MVPEILSDLAEATTRDIWTLEQIRTEALEQKINARVVFVLPWFVLIAMTAKDGAFREFYSTAAGLTVAVIGGVMSLLGIAIASRLGQSARRAEGVHLGQGPVIGSPLVLLAGVASALAAGLLVHHLVPPPRSLASRIHPYLAPARSMSRANQRSGTRFLRCSGRSFARWLRPWGRLLERSGDQVTILKLRQAGWYRQLPEEEMVSAYRVTQLRSTAVAVGLAVVAGWAIGASLLQWLILIGLGLLIGATRQRSKIDKAIETRRELMRIEVYTVNQLLAMRVRAGGGVVHAVTSTVARGRGEVINELADALRLHRAGWRAGDAFRRIAELTPEPFCSRTYRLLASAEERGADLAGALLDLAEDVRETRRESIKRSATKRRAAMLVPTIAILAPVLILFVAAPLPSLITGWR